MRSRITFDMPTDRALRRLREARRLRDVISSIHRPHGGRARELERMLCVHAASPSLLVGDPVDDDVESSVLPDMIANLSERVAAARGRGSAECNARDDFERLAGGDPAGFEHGIGWRELDFEGKLAAGASPRMAVRATSDRARRRNSTASAGRASRARARESHAPIPSRHHGHAGRRRLAATSRRCSPCSINARISCADCARGCD